MPALFALFLIACGGTPAETTASTEPSAENHEAAQPAADAHAADAHAAEASAVPEIQFAELQGLVTDKKVVLVDANGTASFKEAHIPGAIDLAAHEADLAAVLPADKAALVVAYCGGPKCNAWEQGAKAVASLGYTQVKHFKGGISGWKEANGAVEAVQ
jgi:rhodanese-related sulfurtransferase